jgi:hypothetical protein
MKKGGPKAASSRLEKSPARGLERGKGCVQARLGLGGKNQTRHLSNTTSAGLFRAQKTLALRVPRSVNREEAKRCAL